MPFFLQLFAKHKKNEDKKLGVITIVLIIEEEVQRAAVAFVNDTSFYSNRRNIENKIQEILQVYTRLYEATSGRVEQSKSNCYT